MYNNKSNNMPKSRRELGKRCQAESGSPRERVKRTRSRSRTASLTTTKHQQAKSGPMTEDITANSPSKHDPDGQPLAETDQVCEGGDEDGYGGTPMPALVVSSGFSYHDGDEKYTSHGDEDVSSRERSGKDGGVQVGVATSLRVSKAVDSQIGFGCQCQENMEKFPGAHGKIKMKDVEMEMTENDYIEDTEKEAGLLKRDKHNEEMTASLLPNLGLCAAEKNAVTESTNSTNDIHEIETQTQPVCGVLTASRQYTRKEIRVGKTPSDIKVESEISRPQLEKHVDCRRPEVSDAREGLVHSLISNSNSEGDSSSVVKDVDTRSFANSNCPISNLTSATKARSLCMDLDKNNLEENLPPGLELDAPGEGHAHASFLQSSSINSKGRHKESMLGWDTYTHQHPYLESSSGSCVSELTTQTMSTSTCNNNDFVMNTELMDDHKVAGSLGYSQEDTGVTDNAFMKQSEDLENSFHLLRAESTEAYLHFEDSQALSSQLDKTGFDLSKEAHVLNVVTMSCSTTSNHVSNETSTSTDVLQIDVDRSGDGKIPLHDDKHSHRGETVDTAKAGSDCEENGAKKKPHTHVKQFLRQETAIPHQKRSLHEEDISCSQKSVKKFRPPLLHHKLTNITKVTDETEPENLRPRSQALPDAKIQLEKTEEEDALVKDLGSVNTKSVSGSSCSKSDATFITKHMSPPKLTRVILQTSHHIVTDLDTSRLISSTAGVEDKEDRRTSASSVVKGLCRHIILASSASESNNVGGTKAGDQLSKTEDCPTASSMQVEKEIYLCPKCSPDGPTEFDASHKAMPQISLTTPSTIKSESRDEGRENFENAMVGCEQVSVSLEGQLSKEDTFHPPKHKLMLLDLPFDQMSCVAEVEDKTEIRQEHLMNNDTIHAHNVCVPSETNQNQCNSNENSTTEKETTTVPDYLPENINMKNDDDEDCNDERQKQNGSCDFTPVRPQDSKFPYCVLGCNAERRFFQQNSSKFSNTDPQETNCTSSVQSSQDTWKCLPVVEEDKMAAVGDKGQNLGVTVNLTKFPWEPETEKKELVSKLQDTASVQEGTREVKDSQARTAQSLTIQIYSRIQPADSYVNATPSLAVQSDSRVQQFDSCVQESDISVQIPQGLATETEPRVQLQQSEHSVQASPILTFQSGPRVQVPSSLALQSTSSFQPADLNVHQSDNSIHQSDLSVHQSDRSIHQSDLSVHQSDLSVHQSDLSVHQSDISVHQSDLSVHQSDLSVHQSDLSVHQSDRSIHQSDLSVHQSDLSVHQSDLSVHQSDLSVHQSDLSVHQSDLSVYQSDRNIHQPDFNVQQLERGVHDPPSVNFQPDINVSRCGSCVKQSDPNVLIPSTLTVPRGSGAQQSDHSMEVSDTSVQAPPSLTNSTSPCQADLDWDMTDSQLYEASTAGEQELAFQQAEADAEAKAEAEALRQVEVRRSRGRQFVNSIMAEMASMNRQLLQLKREITQAKQKGTFTQQQRQPQPRQQQQQKRWPQQQQAQAQLKSQQAPSAPKKVFSYGPLK